MPCESIGKLTNLQVLDLQSNELSWLPSSTSLLVCLAELRLSDNHFSCFGQGETHAYANHVCLLDDVLHESAPRQARQMLIELAIGLVSLEMPILQILAIHDALCFLQIMSKFRCQLGDDLRWRIAKAIKFKFKK